MTDLWYPAAIRNDAPASLWGSYRDDDGQWKYLLHTTESDSFSPHPSNYFGHTNYPHATAYLPAGQSVARLYQHIPINHAARALKNSPGGVETNADRVVQIEIVGRASNAPNFPKALLDVVRAFGLWVADKTGMPWQSSVRFVAGGAGVRLSGSVFDNYAGILGHQHAPENDHVDPGAIDIGYILRRPTPQEDFDMARAVVNADDPRGVWVTTGAHKFAIGTPKELQDFANNGIIPKDANGNPVVGVLDGGAFGRLKDVNAAETVTFTPDIEAIAQATVKALRDALAP